LVLLTKYITVAPNSLKQPRPVKSDVLRTVSKSIGGTLLALVLVGGSAIAGGLVGLAVSFRNLPDVRQLKGYVPTETSYIYDITVN
jgi:penicillin-binding protein 1A